MGRIINFQSNMISLIDPIHNTTCISPIKAFIATISVSSFIRCHKGLIVFAKSRANLPSGQWWRQLQKRGGGGFFFRGVQEVFKNGVLLFCVYMASRRHACNGQSPLPKTAEVWGRCKKPLNGSRAAPW